MVTRKEALDYHAKGRPGKIEVSPTKPCFTQRDLSLAYTPGVAQPCLEIEKDSSASYLYTDRGNLVAVVTNGTAVLGLGNIGPEAAKPVMEGKGVLFKRFADIDVFDLELNSSTVEGFCAAVRCLEPTFGGINLEDIKAPECFFIEKKLSEEMDIPVFHDDQHGTAIISGAAFLNYLKIAGKKAEEVRVVFSGAGAAAISCARMFLLLGVKEDNLFMVDSRGVITTDRRDSINEFKKPFARETDRKNLTDILDGADVFVGLSKAGLLTKEMVKTMAYSPLIMALANPDPEISYTDAREARPDAIVATGRSDFPNQVNNVLGFPFIFRGALDVRAKKINEEMKVAAVHAIAALAREEVPETVGLAYGGRSFRFGPDYIIPKPVDPRVLTWVAPAVAKAGVESGVARIQIEDWEDYRSSLERRMGQGADVLRYMAHRAKRKPARIVFPEGTLPIVLRAVSILNEEKSAIPILVGNENLIRETIRDMELEAHLEGVEIHQPETSPHYEAYWRKIWKIRERKGMSEITAKRAMSWRLNFASMMVREGHADGLVGGIGTSFPETLRSLFQIIGTAEGFNKVAGCHMILRRNRLYFFADTTSVIDPDAEHLARTAEGVADMVKRFDLEPRIAFLSFSTFGSMDSKESEKMREARRILAQSRPELMADGEMQADIALLPEHRRERFPFCELEGRANVLIFPCLSSGNISYKITQCMGASLVLGPMMVGLNHPATLLNPYATVDEVLQAATVTSMFCGALKGGKKKESESLLHQAQ
jgi:malate dehydrogenase (oxaloacetate-decarboxylating)(NADP+)